MRVTRILCVSILAIVAVPGSAYAGDWYAGASMGVSKYPDSLVARDARIDQQTEVPGFGGSLNGLSPFPGTSSLQTTSTSETGYDFFAGYRLSSHWALEARFFDMGSANSSQPIIGAGPCGGGIFCPQLSADETGTAKANGFSISAVLDMPFADHWGAFLDLGAADTTVKSTTSVLNASVSDKSTKWSPDYGIGVQYSGTSGWSFRLGWRQLHSVGDSNSTGSGNVDFEYLSALYSF